MSKKLILGLDLGVSSIGWALVGENLKNPEENEIIKIGVRVTPVTDGEKKNFEKGKPITTNADRTLARSARRNLQRFKLRRANLLEVLKQHKIISDDDFLTEVGKNTTFQTQELRAKSAKERIELSEFARVLLLINKKRGYKSSRKAKTEDEGKIIDGMAIAKILYERNKTPGEFAYELLSNDKKELPDFYRSDLQNELDRVWNFQSNFYPEILTENLKKEIEGKGVNATWAVLKIPFQIEGIKQKGDAKQKRLEKYSWRAKGVNEQLDLEKLAVVLQEINGNLNNSSSYLGAISDRSKELYFNNQIVGEYLFEQLKKDPHSRLKNQVFYRQDYLDEFNKIWDTQAKYHKELTKDLKEEIRDIIIFYQRKLKSQKGLINFCEFESKEIEIEVDGKKKKRFVGLKVAPKSSPLFQEFKIWQVLNNIEIKNDDGKRALDLDEKELIFEEVNIKGNITGQKALELIGLKSKDVKINFKTIEGNRTNKDFYNAFLKILEIENVFDILKKLSKKDEAKITDINVKGAEVKSMIKSCFNDLGIDSSILDFNAELEGKDFENQSSYQFWHLLYSYEGDDSASGNEKLYELLEKKFGFKKRHSEILAKIAFPQEYGNLSTKAMRKIYPYIKEHKYSDACLHTGYNHSKHSLSKEDLEKRVLKTKLELLPKNALRNPVAEKVLNQMINLVNAIIEDQGKTPDEIRIELSRELKNSAEERANMTEGINKANFEHQKISEILSKEFGIKYASRNDLIRYKLYLELAHNGYKDIYTNTKIEKEDLFTNKYDIDHIIPQSKLFDDSFSNKVLVPRGANLNKGNLTAFDYMEKLGAERQEIFLNTISDLYKNGKISKAKFEKLQKKETEISDGFVERDLRVTQYIARKAKEILFDVTNSVVSTSGRITDRLREDWGIVDVMKELHLPKFRQLGLTEITENSKGENKEIINNWTKRNDHRHHAMDAVTVAFTTHNHIQYLNYLNARHNQSHEMHIIISKIQDKITEEIIKPNGSKKRKFKAPLKNFRKVIKEHLEGVLVSHKTKNKIVTRNVNKIKKKNGTICKTELTPRGQLHKETVYGTAKIKRTKEEKVSAKFDLDMILKVENQKFRNALIKRLQENNNEPKKAFAGKNSLSKNLIYLNDEKTEVVPELVSISWYETVYTIRKEVNANNFKNYNNLDKILDEGVKNILKNRLYEYDGNAKLAFSDLDKNPIWLNKDKGISIKRVTISGVSNVESLHYKKDHFGNEILDDKGRKIPVDFVSTGNNHHVAIYKDADGNLQEKVMSFYEAVERVNQKLPAIDKDYNSHLGWSFLFTMKRNELFVFPSEDFNPNDIDLFDENNFKLISKNLFRVQTISIVKYGNSTVRDFKFRHHLETKVDDVKNLQGISYNQIKSLEPLRNIVKVRLNHLGKIVHVGEY